MALAAIGGFTAAGPAGATPLSGPAAASDPLLDTLSPAVRQMYETAQRAELDGDLRRAATGYGLVHDQDPAFPGATLGLARVLAAQGETDRALVLYGSLPAEAEAVAASAALLLERDPGRAAELYATLAMLRPGHADPHRERIRALLKVDPAAAVTVLDTWLGLEGGALDGALILELARVLMDRGEVDTAAQVLERYLAREPEGPWAPEVAGRLDRLAVEQAARALPVGPGTLPAQDVWARVGTARRQLDAGRLDAAREIVDVLVADSPRVAIIHATLGDVLLAQGDVSGAERAYVIAVALEPDEAEWQVRLGLFLAGHYGGRRHPEAIEHLRRALVVRPAWAEVHAELGRLYSEAGRWDEAIQSWEACLATGPGGDLSGRATAALADLRRRPPSPSGAVPPPGIPGDVPPEAVEGYRVARVYLARGQPDQAQAELLVVLKRAPTWAAAINLEAALWMQRGDEAQAAAAWTRSLRYEPDQPVVQLALGDLHLRSGDVDGARLRYQAAADAGLASAHLRCARLAWDEGRPWAAAAALESYQEAGGNSIEDAAASALRQEVLATVRAVELSGGAGAVLLVGGLGLGLVRRRRQVDLRGLVARAPESAPEVARIAGAIRHEVLKHNTALLPEVALALDAGDHRLVTYAAERLFGLDGRTGGAVGQYRSYIRQLTVCARRHGLRFHPRRDPVLGPMTAAMHELAGLRTALRRPWRADPGVSSRLGRIAGALHDVAYPALGTLIRSLCTLRIDAPGVHAVDTRVRGERGLAGVDLPVLTVEVPEPAPVARMLAPDFEDILANLLRNAYAVIGAPEPPRDRRVGVLVQVEEDEISGLDWVVVRVGDSADRHLSAAELRSRAPHRGLGLVSDLASRHDGAITVESAAVDTARGWTKSVVVRLVGAEEG